MFHPRPISEILRSAGADEHREAAAQGQTLEQLHAERVAKAQAAYDGYKPHRDIRPRKVDAAKAGERNLREEDTTVSYLRQRQHRWIVRVYYLSQGDELLCWDQGPYAEVTAGAIAHPHRGNVKWQPRKNQGPVQYEGGTTSAVDVEIIDVDELGPAAEAQGRLRLPRNGARLVRLPSQQRERVEAFLP